MEELERSKFTAAGEIANERLIEAATEPDRYPEGTAFIAADQEGFGAVLAEAVAEHRPLAIVYPDGREIVAAPRGRARVLRAAADPPPRVQGQASRACRASARRLPGGDQGPATSRRRLSAAASSVSRPTRGTSAARIRA